MSTHGTAASRAKDYAAKAAFFFEAHQFERIMRNASASCPNLP